MNNPQGEKGKLIVLKPRKKNVGYTITQRDLEELVYFERQMRDAALLWKIKRATIRRHLELGCDVEPGLRDAHVDSIKKLVVK